MGLLLSVVGGISYAQAPTAKQKNASQTTKKEVVKNETKPVGSMNAAAQPAGMKKSTANSDKPAGTTTKAADQKKSTNTAIKHKKKRKHPVKKSN